MSRMPREYSSSGIYHIMLSGNEQRNIFLDDADRQKFLETLAKKKTEKECSLYAYCLMDNHIHLVVRENHKQISTIIKGIATSYAMFFNIKYDRAGHVFHSRFKSESVDDEQYLISLIRYVHNNPVQAGIADKPEQYRWSSYHSYVSPGAGENVDAGYVLSMIDGNLNEAVRVFKWFSHEKDDTNYMDEETEMVKTVEEGRAYLEELIAHKWPGVAKTTIIKDKGRRNEVIRDLRSNTGLSIRKTAELLGVNRRVVERWATKQG